MDKCNFTLMICIIFCSSLGYVHTLKCYQCDDCDKVNDTMLITCGSTTTSTTTTESSSSSSQATSPSSVATSPSSVATSPSSAATSPSSVATSPSSEATAPSSVPRVEIMSPRVRRSIVKAEIEFVCFKGVYDVNGKEVTRRGCGISLNDTALMCTTVGVKTGCSTCQEDGCNMAAGTQASIVVLATALIMSFM